MPIPVSRTSDLTPTVPGADLHLDPPSPGGELQRIGQEIPHHLREPARVRIHPDRRIAQRELQSQAALVEDGAHVVAAPLHDLAGIERGPLELDLPVGDPVDVQQVVHQPGEVLGLSMEDLAGPPRRIAPRRGPVEREHAVPDRRERVPELMGEDGEEVGLSLISLAERLLDLPSLGDVDERGHGSVRASLVVAEGRRIGEDVAHRPVLELQSELVVPDLHPLAGGDLDGEGLGGNGDPVLEQPEVVRRTRAR